jgi:hypothetical protein
MKIAPRLYDMTCQKNKKTSSHIKSSLRVAQFWYENIFFENQEYYSHRIRIVAPSFLVPVDMTTVTISVHRAIFGVREV